MSKWTVNRISDFAEIIAGGTPSTSVDEYWNGNIGWITPADLSNYKCRYISRGERNITELGLKKSSACLLPKNSVLLSSRAPIGYVAIAGTELATNQGFKNLICDDRKVDYRFIYYWLSLNTEVLKSFASGATFPEISASKVKKIKAIIPDLPTQKRIADILSTYDELIENNNRRIAILEKAAQELYKEWFVRFRFPDYENAKFENGLPKGWYVAKMGSLCNITTGKKDANQATGNGEYPFFTCARETTLFTDDFILDKNAILISGNGSYTGLVKKYSGKFDLYQRTYALYDFKNIEWLYAYWTMKINFEREFMGGSRGSAIPYITRPNIERFKIVVPTQELLLKSQQIFETIHNKCLLLESENKNLIKQRDLLLPRLMSGKLEV